MDSDIVFEWGSILSKKLTTKVKLIDEECSMYNSYKFGAMEVQVGDHVIIRGGRKRDFVARVKALYDTGASNDSRHRAMVQWYCNKSDIHSTLRKSLDKYPPIPKPWQEIFADRSNNCVDDIDAETISQKCKVVKVNVNLTNLPSNTEEMPCFLLRWKYFGDAIEPINTTSQISGVADEDEFYSDEVDSEEGHTKWNDLEISNFKVKTPNKYCDTPSTNSQLKLKLIRLNTRCRPRKAKSLTRLRIESSEDVLNVSPTAKLASTMKKMNLKNANVTSLKSSSGRKIKINKRYSTESDDDEKHKKTPISVNLKNKSTTDAILMNKQCAVNLVRSPCSVNHSPKSDSEDFKTPVKVSRLNGPISKSTGRGRKPSRSSKAYRKIIFSDDSCSPVKRCKPEKPQQTLCTRSGRKINIRLWNDGVDSDVESLTNDYVPGKQSSSEDEESEIENRPEKSRTPRRRICKPKSTPSSTVKGNKKCITPLISKRETAVQTPQTDLELAKVKLYTSSIPDALPCREKEFADIYTFIEGKVATGTGGCMYISGVPGTGKTATVSRVIQHLQSVSESGELPSFKFISVNGMKMTEPRQAFVQIYKNLFGQKVTMNHAGQLLCNYFESKKKVKNRETVVLLVDELDLLCNRKQDVLYNIFNWPNKQASNLVVIAIANTMDLPERVMKHRIASRVGLTRITFQPYTFKQLREIILARLGESEAFDSDSIQFIARKVAAVSGDARRALDICRRATELVEDCPASPQKKGSRVGMTEADKAIHEMFSSPKIEVIRHSSLQERTFLKAVVCEFQRTGLEESTFAQVYKQHAVLCRIEGIRVPNTCEALFICANLGSCRLLILEQTERRILQKVKLNLSTDDVSFALRRPFTGQ